MSGRFAPATCGRVTGARRGKQTITNRRCPLHPSQRTTHEALPRHPGPHGTAFTAHDRRRRVTTAAMSFPPADTSGRTAPSIPAQVLDVVLVLGYVVVAGFALGGGLVQGTVLQPLLGLPFLLFLPGYALVAALFPHRPAPDDEGGMTDGAPLLARRVDLVERAALSFGMSVAILPMLALGLSATPTGIQLPAVVGVISVVVVVGILVSVVRRLRVPAEERYYAPVGGWVKGGLGAVFTPPSVTDGFVNLALILSVVLAFSTVTFALVVPNHQSSYTSFYLLTENESGDLVASDYPTSFASGESKDLVMGIENHERQETTYTVVIELQRVERSEQGVRILEQQELGRKQVTLGPNQTWTGRQTISPGMTGEDLRLKFFLYRGEAPSDPNSESAYRHVHLWIDVGAADATNTSKLDRPSGAAA